MGRQSLCGAECTNTNTCLSLLEGSEPLLEARGQNKVTSTCQESQFLPEVRILTKRQLLYPHLRSRKDEALTYTKTTLSLVLSSRAYESHATGTASRRQWKWWRSFVRMPLRLPLSEYQPVNAREQLLL